MMKTNDFKEPEPVLVNGINYTGDKGPMLGVRHFQVFIMGLGMAIGFSSKSVLSLAIVAMTDNSTSSNPDVPAYDWDNKSTILSSVLWSGVFINLIAGYFAQKYGPKWIVVGAGLVNSTFLLLIPVSAQIGGSAGVIVCRLFQGLALGCLYPLNSAVMGRWVPPEERSRLGYLSTGLLAFLVTIVFVLTGFISSSYLGWPWVFYILGIFSMSWTACFAIFAVQSADVHRSISPKEKTYLLTTLSETNDNEQIPLRKIISSIHVWAIIIGQSGFNWMTILLANEMSLFLSKVMGYDLKSNGIISAIPPLVGSISGALTSVVSDFIPNRGILSVVNSRRTFHLAGNIGIGASLICMTFVPVEQRIWAVVLLCFCNVLAIATAVGGASTNILDISPKFAGVIMGFSQTLSQAVSLFAPLAVQWICTTESDVNQWRIVFILSTIICIGTGIFFVIFASGQRQDWETESALEAELEVRKRKSSILSMSVGLGP